MPRALISPSMHTLTSKSLLQVSTWLVFAICAAVLLAPVAVRAQDPPHGRNCPTDVPGTTIVAAAIADGAALLFFAPRHVGELRKRVRALSAHQNEGAVTPPETAPPVVRKLEPETEPHEPIATVYDVHGGVMLKLTPSKMDQLADVQARVFDYAQRIMGGECPLPRAESTVIRKGTPRPQTTNHAQLPSGAVPGTPAIDTPAVVVPSLVI
jgi:hypothetical protein